VIRRRDQHDIESFFQHLPPISIGRGFFFETCLPAVISAASASIVLSTSHNDTTSTGETWMSRKIGLPIPTTSISPTRFFWSAKSTAKLGGGRREGRGAGLEKKSAVHADALPEPHGNAIRALYGWTRPCFQQTRGNEIEFLP
jgi:hypothetical protein